MHVPFAPQQLQVCLGRATLTHANASIDGQRVDEWTVRGEILDNDTYTAWVRADGDADADGEVAVPVRTLWVDPVPGGEPTPERSDYSNMVGAPPESEFVPNKHCQSISC